MLLYTLALVSTYLFLKFWEGFAKEKGFVGRDINKYGEVYVPEGGGIPVFIMFLFFLSFLLPNNPEFHYLLIPTFLGFLIGALDDVWKPGGLPWKVKLLLTFLVPLSVLPFLDKTTVDFYFFKIDSRIFYLIIFTIIGIGWTNAVNTLAGFNGIEAGLSIVILLTLSFLSPERPMIYLMVFCLLAFLIENWYPAKVFPGDSLTYGVGAFIAAISMKNGFLWQSFFLLIPYFIDNIWMPRFFWNYFVKKEKKEVPKVFGIPQPDGSIEIPDFPDFLGIFGRIIKKIKGRCYEYEITISAILVEALCGLLVMLLS